MKLAKSLLVVIALGVFCVSINAQSSVTDEMYRKLKSEDGFTYLAFSKTLLDFVDIDLDDVNDEDYKVTGDLHEVKLLLYNPKGESKQNLREHVMPYIKRGKFDLVESDDNDDDSEVWVKRHGKKVSECHVIFQGDNNGGVMSFFGDFTVEDLKTLSKKAEDYK